jgi:hypothetical protein
MPSSLNQSHQRVLLIRDVLEDYLDRLLTVVVVYAEVGAEVVE